jgi:hypothetical protein
VNKKCEERGASPEGEECSPTMARPALPAPVHGWSHLVFTGKARPHWKRFGDGTWSMDFSVFAAGATSLQIDSLEESETSSKRTMLALDKEQATALCDFFCAAYRRDVAPDTVPDGWRLVPREATENMHQAAHREWDGRMSARSAGVWDAMIEAAPRYKGAVAPVNEAEAKEPAPELQQPATAEAALEAEGVFKGMHGLRGLLDAREFWEAQMYGTRLYYGHGGQDYLHHSVLKAAVDALDKAGVVPKMAPAAPAYKAIGWLDHTDGELFIDLPEKAEKLRKLGHRLTALYTPST